MKRAKSSDPKEEKDFDENEGSNEESNAAEPVVDNGRREFRVVRFKRSRWNETDLNSPVAVAAPNHNSNINNGGDDAELVLASTEQLAELRARLQVYRVEHRGLYHTMEDKSVILTGDELIGALPASDPSLPVSMFVAIYDGHGGGRISTYLQQHLHERLFSALDRHRPQRRGELRHTVQQCFERLDDEILTHIEKHSPSHGRWSDGSCALVLFLYGLELVCCYVGDSDAIVMSARETNTAADSSNSSAAPLPWSCETLTAHHNAGVPSERQRVLRNGGTIERWSGDMFRVTHDDTRTALAISRAFGDYEFKRPRNILSACPDVSFHTVQLERDRWLILASDGLWDALTPQDVTELFLPTAADCHLAATRRPPPKTAAQSDKRSSTRRQSSNVWTSALWQLRDKASVESADDISVMAVRLITAEQSQAELLLNAAGVAAKEVDEVVGEVVDE